MAKNAMEIMLSLDTANPTSAGAPRDFLGSLGLKDSLVLMDTLDLRDTQAMMVPLAIKDLLDLLDLKVNLKDFVKQ